ncbi:MULTISPECIES: MFS transporter [Comamonas]|uniref:MFS transporter n=1 Tax=Comamonas TaxID=283 RepID=UPI00050DFFEA|nr:MFS transporter [Comamonas thiooxydans]KGG87016.1 membrane protein [Comamonas thiooxydans]MCO8249528.1 MFS transporter [Comamonas thiooxydans]MDH1252343.1 MFS transporter [Comamonas thiooxydans]MDH1475165.1 MFS transporter [Comamonas thiooxydans]QOQ84761.1 MFS transporter [Comamonas thiooxydans]
MTSQERRSSGALALIFALRMLGLFLVLPVFMLEARKYPGGDDPAMIGLAMGLYGLTQALFQLPIGLASDRIGRKRVIVAGLLVFAAGSLIAAMADSLTGLMAGRAIQGAGAVSAAVTALLADLTRDGVRTKAMAMVGGSIGLMFALALVLAPLLNAWIGLSGIFGLTCALALAGIAVVLWVVPPEPRQHADAPKGRFSELLGQSDLLRLNFGVFILHTVQMSMWVAVPAMLVQAGLAKEQHWHIYLPAVLLSFLAMGLLFSMERKGKLRKALLGAIGLVLVVQIGLGMLAASGTIPTVWCMALLMFLFFCGFNALEATQPSLVSRMAPAPLRGAALGAYNTLQSLGLFAGGAVGGAVAKFAGVPGLFIMTAVLVALWLVVTWPLRPVGRH